MDREERRARAGLETLVKTTPVGVLVFDAKTGGVTSLNREARRIVNDLCAPGGWAEQLLEVLTFRRADERSPIGILRSPRFQPVPQKSNY